MSLLRYEDALAQVLAWVQEAPSERLPLTHSLGQVLARDVYSEAIVPNSDVASMDGFAVRSSELANCSKSSPVSLGVVGHIGAGDDYQGSVQAGHCVRIMTGAPLPEGLDSVIKLEDVAIRSGDGFVGSLITYGYPLIPGQNVMRAGSRAQMGEFILGAGSVVDPAAIGALAASANFEVDLISKPRVAIIPLGNELVPLREIPQNGEVRNSNLFALSAYVRRAGGQDLGYYIVKDKQEELSHALMECSTQADIVVITGGSASGDYDVADKALRASGELIYSELLVNPGHTQGFGIINRTPVFSLPGNPYAAYCAFELLVRPAIRKAAGFKKHERTRVVVRLAHDINKGHSKPDYPLYLRAQLRLAPDGVFEAHVPDPGEHSALLAGAHGCNAMLMLEPGEENRRQGAHASCLLLDEE